MQLQFAISNAKRIEAAPGLNAECPQCSKPVIAKCGPIRVWHWAHRGERTCDPWWENQTPWHLAWKSEFPVESREVIAQDPDGERHIADVKMSNGLCIEFQHSHLRPEERAAREKFYGSNLVWVVNGTRLKRDQPRFVQGRQQFRRIGKHPIFLVPFPDECFPQDWLNCRALVLFDFCETAETRAPDAKLWGLLPGRADGQAVVVAMGYREFVDTAQKRAEVIPARRWLAEIDTALRRQREMESRQRSRLSWNTSRWSRRRRTPRF
jgi:competence protein CoiA